MADYLRCIVFNPEYEFSGLTEKQFRALKAKMNEIGYENFDSNSPEVKHHISSRGGKLYRREDRYYFVMDLNFVSYRKYCTIQRNLADGYILMKRVVNEMDKIAKELEKIVEDNKDP